MPVTKQHLHQKNKNVTWLIVLLTVVALLFTVSWLKFEYMLKQQQQGHEQSK